MNPIRASIKRIRLPIAGAVVSAALLAALAPAGCQPRTEDASKPLVRVGSKGFTESVILGEIVTDLARDPGAQAQAHHHSRLGDTSAAWNALINDHIDVYCDYTGTLRYETLANEDIPDDAALPEALKKYHLHMSRPLGFSNSYAIGMKEETAEKKGITRMADLKAHPELKFGVSTIFLKRNDGWENLRDWYKLPFPEKPQSVDHGLIYEALNTGPPNGLDVADIYLTDPQIQQYHLRVLEDDGHYFPAYGAVLLYRDDLEERAPNVVRELLRLEGKVSEDDMRTMNARATLERIDEKQVAAEFLKNRFQIDVVYHVETMFERIGARTLEHLWLVSIALILGVIVAVPLGVMAARRPWLGHVVLGVVGTVQTMPALALLVLLVVWLGLGDVPAIVALFCYSLLPIVRSTYTGLHDIPLTVRESAEALGLSSFARLRLIELPMASRSILAGVKTAAVIAVGNATLGGLIGAGGYGETIYIGLSKNDWRLLLEGAIPAMGLALVIQGVFDGAERFLVPKGLRLKTGGETNRSAWRFLRFLAPKGLRLRPAR